MCLYMNNHILPFSCQESVKLYLLTHSCKDMAITTEIKRNCLDGIHSNVLSVLHQILFYIIVALIAITFIIAMVFTVFIVRQN